MECETPCSFVKKFRKLAGFLDIVIGAAGIFTICYFTYVNRTRRNGLATGTEKLPFIASELDDELIALDTELCIDAILYVVPSLVTILVGLLILVAAMKDSFAWSKIAITMTLALIGVCSAIVGVTFGLGTYWMRLIPLAVNTGVQVLVLAIAIEMYFSSQHLVKLQ